MDNEKLDMILSKLEKLDTIENEVNGIKNTLDNEVKEIRKTLDNDVNSIKMILENEIRVNIQRIAEGHLDLSRNLHDAMKPSNEIEMLAIKVRALESEVGEIKRKIS